MSEGDDSLEEPVTVSGSPTEDPGGAFAGAPDDREMPLTQHIEEMLRRVAVVIVVMALVSALTFPFADRLINFLWFSFLPGSPANCPPIGTDIVDACARLYHPLALLLARLKVASLVGFIAALPVFVYETYLFMRPGLYHNERRYYLASVPTSLVLAGIGLAFAYFLVLPLIFTYFLGYSQPVAEVAFGLSETFGLILLMLGMFALVFQIPLFVMLAIMMGVTSRRWLEDRRLYFWAGFAGLAFLFSPDPTGMAPFMVAATMVGLFEGTLLLLRWSGEGSMVPSTAQVARLRPLVWLVVTALGYLASPAPVPEGYYDAIPTVVTSTIADLGMGGAEPVLIGVGLLAAYEGMLLLIRRRWRAPRLYRQLARTRLPAWVAAIVVGYLGSPDPTLLRFGEGAVVSTPTAAGAVVVVIAAYELGIAIRRRQGPRDGA